MIIFYIAFIYLHTSQGESGSKILMAFVISDLENKIEDTASCNDVTFRVEVPSCVHLYNSHCFVLLALTVFSIFCHTLRN